MHNNDGEMLDDLILSGAVEVSGIDQETGEFLYSFTEKIMDVDPDLANRIEESFHKDVMELWEKGFLSIDFTTDSPLVSLDERALDEDLVSGLSLDLRTTLKNIMQAMRSNN